jgi:hypothetical protein
LGALFLSLLRIFSFISNFSSSEFGSYSSQIKNYDTRNNIT